MVRSGFNYNAASFLSSASRPGFWSRATLVSEGAHRQYRIHNEPHVLQPAPARKFDEAGAWSDVDAGRAIEDRAAA
jgi:hypothetical protein